MVLASEELCVTFWKENDEYGDVFPPSSGKQVNKIFDRWAFSHTTRPPTSSRQKSQGVWRLPDWWRTFREKEASNIFQCPDFHILSSIHLVDVSLLGSFPSTLPATAVKVQM